ncbi:hypothetical protein CEUSTIGMA_g9629.t1 [Chlamydomonas eustigma]|uniref:Retroviral polymerase SH3-like domain-containing protein n=1 Tax=Chlamydomonas eustigma TaxID=1157962 RepID=A0A250XGJ5_9CHLO|nr:hypothetical protein CEUSTIGMA_g9629.t1 [Chlamydomonas eustigma]|eukprot:GAX82201.1 hypothetical protein CEUSTIGMA_g9629.t1 [Chlamydomonas eustigma]
MEPRLLGIWDEMDLDPRGWGFRREYHEDSETNAPESVEERQRVRGAGQRNMDCVDINMVDMTLREARKALTHKGQRSQQTSGADRVRRFMTPVPRGNSLVGSGRATRGSPPLTMERTRVRLRAIALAASSLTDAIRRDWLRTTQDLRTIDNGFTCADWLRGHASIQRVKPDVSIMRIFGSIAYVHTPKELRKKLDPKGKLGIFLGYEPHAKAYRILVDGKVKISKDVVVVDESKFILLEKRMNVVDADYARDMDTRRSTTSYVFSMHGGAISMVIKVATY